MSLLVAEHIFKTYRSSGLFGLNKKEGAGIRDISFRIEPAMCLGILGESGAGKSTLGNIMLGLLRPDSGSVKMLGTDLYQADKKERIKLRREIQVVFQDCYSAVNPRFSVKHIISEPLRNYERLSPQEEIRKVTELLEVVGLRPDDMLKKPHQLSGGQLQRVNIARAIALEPKLIVLDEPVSSLDMVVQKQILLHLQDLKKKKGLSYLLISHDVLAVSLLADQIAVLDGGQIVEKVAITELLSCSHPASRRLLDAAL
ncbi:nickel import ATP-binding protein NikE [Paenibacillus ferrarius]|uniref:Nickel import ATP-binding protein NikE n=1 Tax=Paenibacillus ferrarius TaxID=1469647 RepID=A0A1V4HC24_9BACL|nr:ATP-binding cassette domain-containing protein [Paenibacillus ferrarius]OPH50497.1 nickel import ATP-binding protein NikE [Paenibacillus ferrarius]